MILVTGASKGIGKYLFERFIEFDNNVYGTYYSTRPPSKYQNNYTLVDISDYYSVANWIKKIKNTLDQVTLLNCAGVNYNSLAHKADINQWSQIINTNLIGTFTVIHAVLPIMREQGFGRIINFSSVVAQTGVPGTSAYAASKSGLWGLVKSIAVENAKKGITINNLNLGYFDIGMISEVPEKFQNKIKENIPTGNFGNPNNIFLTIKYLIKMDYINGSNIDINAGLF